MTGGILIIGMTGILDSKPSGMIGRQETSVRMEGKDQGDHGQKE
jgi:hypothetical protein